MLAEAEINAVLFHYLKTVFFVALNFAIAYIVVGVASTKWPRMLSERRRLVYLVAGTGFLLVAGIGKLDWSIQTIDDSTPAETVNDWFFFVLSNIGTFLLFVELTYLLMKKQVATGHPAHSAKGLMRPNAYLMIGAGTMLLVGVCSGLSKNYQLMWMAFFSSVGLLLFGNLDKLKSFKLSKSGLEAETRTVVKDMKCAIKEVQALSKITATSTLGLVKRTGRWGGYSFDEKETIKKQTLEVLCKIGLTEGEIEEVVEDSKWHKFVELDYVHFILGGAQVPKNLPEAELPTWKEFRRRGLDNLPGPEELSAFLGDCGLLTEEGRALIQDYRHYIKCREQRRPQVWANRGAWDHLHTK